MAIALDRLPFQAGEKYTRCRLRTTKAVRDLGTGGRILIGADVREPRKHGLDEIARTRIGATQRSNLCMTAFVNIILTPHRYASLRSRTRCTVMVSSVSSQRMRCLPTRSYSVHSNSALERSTTS